MLARQGIRALVNNRPDGEAPGQPSSAELAVAAASAGLAYRHIPVVPGQLREREVGEFARALAELPAPLLAFCRTGTRSTTLWALGAVRAGQPVEEILACAAKAGHDLSALRPRLQEAAR